MDKNNETSRVNVVIGKDVQNYYKAEAKRYNLPYTNYIAMIITRIYENDKELNKNNHKS